MPYVAEPTAALRLADVVNIAKGEWREESR